MAADHYTHLHNLVFRGCGIHTKYVGVFGYIASHTDGWTLTETKVAQDLGVGRDFIRAALKNFEAAQCLIRTRERHADGTLGDSVWFITDLPAQLLQLGVADPEVVTASVAKAYDEWKSPQVRAYGGNAHTQGLTSENSAKETVPPTPVDEDAENPRSEPMSGFPTLAQPTLAQPTLADPPYKKNRDLEEQPTNQPTVGGLVGASPKRDDPLGTPGAKLLAGLPEPWKLGRSAIQRLAPSVDDLLASGWSAAGLVTQWTSRPADNPPGALGYRISETMPAPARTAPARAVPVLPACDICNAREGDPVGVRTVEHNARVGPCECSPRYQASAVA